MPITIHFSYWKSVSDLALLTFLFLPIHFLILNIHLLYLIKGEKQIYFKQLRSGKEGRPFWIYKFRTLPYNHMKSVSFMGLMRKSGLDELPQIWNIIRGDMSFVGPRPLLHEYMSTYSSEQKQRFLVKPGITGLAQINGRNSIPWSEKFAYDIQYVENFSFLMDFVIITRTFFQLFSLRKNSAEPTNRFDRV